jgi:hypothetical protein
VKKKIDFVIRRGHSSSIPDTLAGQFFLEALEK